MFGPTTETKSLKVWLSWPICIESLFAHFDHFVANGEALVDRATGQGP
jgi:hypothetical protein